MYVEEMGYGEPKSRLVRISTRFFRLMVASHGGTHIESAFAPVEQVDMVRTPVNCLLGFAP